MKRAIITAVIVLIVLAVPLLIALLRGGDSWESEYRTALAREVDLAYEGTDVQAFVEAFSDATRLNLVLAPECVARDLRANLAGHAVASSLLNDASERFKAQWGLMDHAVYLWPEYRQTSRDVRSQVVFLNPENRRERVSDTICRRIRFRKGREPDRVSEGLLNRRLNVEFDKVPVAQVLKTLEGDVGSVFANEEAARYGAITLRAKGMPFRCVLAWVARLRGCEFIEWLGRLGLKDPCSYWKWRSEGRARATPRWFPGGEVLVSINWEDIPLASAIADLNRQCSVPIELSKEVQQALAGARITMTLSGVEVQRALGYAVALFGVTYQVCPDRVLVAEETRTNEEIVASEEKLNREHNVKRLVAQGFDKLDVLVSRCIVPECWGEQMGTSISLDRSGILHVTHIENVQHSIEWFLGEIKPWDTQPNLESGDCLSPYRAPPKSPGIPW